MATSYNTKSISTNGLLVYLDAANPKSYPGSGTTWYDLSGGNNDFTLSSGSASYSTNIAGGEFTMNATNIWQNIGFYGRVVKAVPPSTVENYNQNATWEAWVKPTTVDGTNRFIVANGNNNEGYILVTSSGVTIATPYATTYSTTVSNKWYHMVRTHKRDVVAGTYSHSLWLDGVKVLSDVDSTLISSTGSTYGPDNTINLGFNFIGQYAVFRFYSRVLSDAEVVSNFTSSKTRFGL